ncbi:restriction endonuclease subunit S [Staphylococcus aureus]|uniref:restriction endonuclease subunit S n=1 Tax=Staphylococcus aureus TaxID=1280 RepID=UPI00067CDF20|nr:restriction endonuclease subunit S [Staphylococcus aureus]
MEPFLRFSEFNKDWEYNFFSEIVTNKTKRIDPKKEESLKDIELDSIEQNTGRLLNTYISKDFTSQKNKFDKGSVLYSKLRPYLNKYYYAKIDGVCSSEIWVLNSLNNEKLSNLFLYYFIQSDRFKNVANKSAGSKMPRADWGLIENIKLYKGLIEEQEKIGEFFSKLDRQIELEEQKLAKLEEQKKGYMQKIFSKELRFKDENGNNYPEWEDKKLLNVIGIQNGYAFKSNLFSEKGMPIIRITDINKSTVKKGTVYYPESIEINERFKIKQYDILIAMSGATTGKVGKYISEKPSLLNQRIGKFVMKKGTDNNFMFIYLNSLYFKKELSKLLVAGAQPNISSQDIENINLFIPINEEQRKIGEFFNELDELIEKQSSKIGVLKQRKKGFLQKMFV